MSNDIPDEIIERCARAIAAHDFPDTKWKQWTSSSKDEMRKTARAALTAVRYGEMREALEDIVEYMTARSDFEIGGDDDSHAYYAAGVVGKAREVLGQSQFGGPVRAWNADDWARAKEDQKRGAEFLKEYRAALSPDKDETT